MAIQNKIYIGFESNHKEWFSNPDEFVKTIKKKPGIYLFIVIRPEKKEGFQKEYDALIHQIYDRKSVEYAKDSDTYEDTIQDLLYEIENKRLCNENTEIIVLKNKEFYNEFIKTKINCKSITEAESLTKNVSKPRATSLSNDVFVAAIKQRQLEVEAANNTKQKIVNETPIAKPAITPITGTTQVNNTSSANTEIAKQKISLMGKLPEEQKVKDSRTILDLEKSIFSSVFDEEINLTYSKVDDAKAELVHQLSNRLIDHINLVYPDIKALDLNYPEYTKTFEMFNKASDSNIFLNLWIDKFPNYAIKSDQDRFEKIKGEALYYFRVCNFLYNEDNYDVLRL